MTCHDQCCPDSLRISRTSRTSRVGRTSRISRLSRSRRGADGAWTAAVAAALLTLQLAAAASTGARDGGGGDPMAAAESKKLTAGKASAVDGYVLTGSNKGDKGYNEDDAFGDKDSDSYGFGTQVSYGNRAGDGGNGAYHHSTAYDDNGRSNPKYSAWHFEDKDGRPTKRYVFDSHKNAKKNRDPLAVEAEASEYDSVEAYDDGDDGSHAGYEVDDAEPEYGGLYDSADAYNDADTYY